MLKCCFNCGSTECSIAKCPHPKNPAEINRRKEEFNAMFGSMGTPRYFKIFQLQRNFPNCYFSRPIGNSRYLKLCFSIELIVVDFVFETNFFFAYLL